jgi:hypothetical protein
LAQAFGKSLRQHPRDEVDPATSSVWNDDGNRSLRIGIAGSPAATADDRGKSD